MLIQKINTSGNIHLSQDTILNIESNVDLWITYENNININVEINVLENVEANIVHYYAIEQLTETLHYHLHLSSTTKIVFTQLQHTDINQKIEIDLIGEYAKVEVASGLLIKNKHQMDIIITHKAKHTYANMEHYAVVSDNAIFKLYGVGKICEKMSGSSAHQTTRVLTMAKNHLCEVTPVLIIDENDVAASHANSIGQPDDMQLYYLQSRGLSIEQSLNLISSGYLEPMLILMENTSLFEQLKTMLESKVG